MIWNGLAARAGNVFVSGPRWSGSLGPALAQMIKGEPVPFPDRAWNAWKAGDDASKAFVNINAIHDDGHGGLWAVDSGSPQFGGNPLPDGAKLVHLDMDGGKIVRVYLFADTVAKPGSYVDDVRFHGKVAYLTDAGNPGLIVLDLATGNARRVLDDNSSVTARAERPIIVDGATL